MSDRVNDSTSVHEKTQIGQWIGAALAAILFPVVGWIVLEPIVGATITAVVIVLAWIPGTAVQIYMLRNDKIPIPYYDE